MSSIDKAYELYSRHIYDEDKIRLLMKHSLKIAGSVPSVLWELFGALLTERSGGGTTGADLQGWEVKSAIEGGSYEYQYHLNTGAAKLKEDCEINHLFCTYSKTYKDVVVRAIQGKARTWQLFFLRLGSQIIKKIMMYQYQLHKEDKGLEKAFPLLLLKEMVYWF